MRDLKATMNNNTILISVFDKNEDFIGIQHASVLKHIKGEYEYIIFNNSSDKQRRKEINKICEKLKIKCIEIEAYHAKGLSRIAAESFLTAFENFKDEKIFKIDSDMFFMSDINLSELCNKSDINYIETYNKYIWSGVFSLNMEKVKIKLNFNPNFVPDTDTFGQSHLLLSDNELTRNKMYFYCILDSDGDTIKGSINGCTEVTVCGEKIISLENNFFDHLADVIPQKLINVKSKINKYNFPKPYNIDFIQINDVDTIIHFKSSNWGPLYKNKEYTEEKKKAIKLFLEDN